MQANVVVASDGANNFGGRLCIVRCMRLSIVLCSPMHSLLILTTWTQGTSRIEARLAPFREHSISLRPSREVYFVRRQIVIEIQVPSVLEHLQCCFQLTTNVSPHALSQNSQYQEPTHRYSHSPQLPNFSTPPHFSVHIMTFP